MEWLPAQRQFKRVNWIDKKLYPIATLKVGMGLWRYLQEIYDRPKKAWYEGHPPFLPKTEAELIGQNSAIIPARLSGLSARGCYAYPKGQITTPLDFVQEVRLKLESLEFHCAVQLIHKTKDGLGFGFRFKDLSMDQKKDLLEFIDQMRSRGYVS